MPLDNNVAYYDHQQATNAFQNRMQKILSVFNYKTDSLSSWQTFKWLAAEWTSGYRTIVVIWQRSFKMYFCKGLVFCT